MTMRLITAALLILACAIPAYAQNVLGDVSGNTGIIMQAQPSFQLTGPTCLTVPSGISLCSDGTVTIPKGMKVTAAARQFMAEIQKAWPAICHSKGE